MITVGYPRSTISFNYIRRWTMSKEMEWSWMSDDALQYSVWRCLLWIIHEFFWTLWCNDGYFADLDGLVCSVPAISCNFSSSLKDYLVVYFVCVLLSSFLQYNSISCAIVFCKSHLLQKMSLPKQTTTAVHITFKRSMLWIKYIWFIGLHLPLIWNKHDNKMSFYQE